MSRRRLAVPCESRAGGRDGVRASAGGRGAVAARAGHGCAVAVARHEATARAPVLGADDVVARELNAVRRAMPRERVVVRRLRLLSRLARGERGLDLGTIGLEHRLVRGEHGQRRAVEQHFAHIDVVVDGRVAVELRIREREVRAVRVDAGRALVLPHEVAVVHAEVRAAQHARAVEAAGDDVAIRAEVLLIGAQPAR